MAADDHQVGPIQPLTIGSVHPTRYGGKPNPISLGYPPIGTPPANVKNHAPTQRLPAVFFAIVSSLQVVDRALYRSGVAGTQAFRGCRHLARIVIVLVIETRGSRLVPMTRTSDIGHRTSEIGLLIIDESPSQPIHRFTHSPIHPFTDSPIHPFTDSPIHPFTDSPIHRFTHSPIHRLTDLLSPLRSLSTALKPRRRAQAPGGPRRR